MSTPGLHKHIHTSVCEPHNVHTWGGGKERGGGGRGRESSFQKIRMLIQVDHPSSARPRALLPVTSSDPHDLSHVDPRQNIP